MPRSGSRATVCAGGTGVSTQPRAYAVPGLRTSRPLDTTTAADERPLRASRELSPTSARWEPGSGGMAIRRLAFWVQGDRTPARATLPGPEAVARDSGGGDMRYVDITEDADIPTIDAALASLRTRRKAAGYALVRAWIDAEIDQVLDMRLKVNAYAVGSQPAH